MITVFHRANVDAKTANINILLVTELVIFNLCCYISISKYVSILSKTRGQKYMIVLEGLKPNIIKMDYLSVAPNWTNRIYSMFANICLSDSS